MLKSITVKIFIIISLAITIMTGGIMVIQSLLFQDYYKDSKIKAVEKYTKEIARIYASAADRFSKEVSMDVLNYSSDYNLSIIYMEYPGFTDDKWGSLLGIDKEKWKESGKIEDKPLITVNADKDKDFYLEEVYRANNYYVGRINDLYPGEHFTYITKDKYGSNLIVTVTNTINSQSRKELLYVFSVLQMGKEAGIGFHDYYLQFFSVAIIIILIISFTFSKQITKPLIHLNKVASEIADLDFSKECTLKSKDELGNLGNTINRLSNNLNSTIRNLEENNSKLSDEIKKQKELQEMQKLFVAGVSHELKTPISVIQGYMERIVDGIENGDLKKEYAYIIQDEAVRMNQIVSDMLDLAQLESGKYQLAEEEISINRILKYECKKFDVMLLKKRINFKLDIEKESIIVKADSFRIEQVLSNLMQNAFRYTPDHGYIVIKVAEEEDYVLISIENSCPQIPEEELHRIWDHFYRIDKSRNIYMGGTGLGLSIVKNILELHDSRYGVERTQNGVRFYFTLQKYNDTADEV